MPSFVQIKPSRNSEITLLSTDKGKTNMSFNAIRKNKILTKISGFTAEYMLRLQRTIKFCTCNGLYRSRTPDESAFTIENCFFYFTTKPYVVGTQKNRLNETVL